MGKVPSEHVGVSVVTGAIMVLAVFFITFSLFLAFWVPRQGYDKEREQMEAVEGSFLKLKSAVETLELLGSRSVDVKMSPDRSTIFPLPSSAGSLLVEPALGFGVVQFDKRNSFYRNQTWVYEGGAVILVQDNVDIMISPPPMVTAVDAGGSNIRVEVHVVRITGAKSSASGMGLSTLLVSLRNSAYMESPTSGPNRKHVIIAVDSIYKNAWAEYLRYLKKLLDEKGYNAVLDEGALTLTIFGKGAPGVNDIYYYEKVTEVEVAVR